MFAISALKPGITDEVAVVAFSRKLLELWEQSPKPPAVRMVFRKGEDENIVVVTEDEGGKKTEKTYHKMTFLMP